MHKCEQAWRGTAGRAALPGSVPETPVCAPHTVRAARFRTGRRPMFAAESLEAWAGPLSAMVHDACSREARLRAVEKTGDPAKRGRAASGVDGLPQATGGPLRFDRPVRGLRRPTAGSDGLRSSRRMILHGALTGRPGSGSLGRSAALRKRRLGESGSRCFCEAPLGRPPPLALSTGGPGKRCRRFFRRHEAVNSGGFRSGFPQQTSHLMRVIHTSYAQRGKLTPL